MNGLARSLPPVVTFGCRLNIVESDTMQSLAEQAGVDDATIVNTCAVTAESVRKSRGAVRRALRDRPDGRVVVTGCASEIAHDDFAGLSNRVVVLPNAAKTEPSRWATLAGKSHVEAGSTAPAAPRSHTRGFLAVQNGCDHRCTFCTIPFGRGPSRSVPIAAVVKQARALVEHGCRDITLTGVDLTAWGNDLGEGLRLGHLVTALLHDVPDLPRLRLSSLDCIEADAALLDAIATEDRLMPHLHLSLQAGDDLVLKRMKRRHTREGAVRFCEQVRRLRPDIVFGADLIVGFPTETVAMFAGTFAIADDCGLTHLHVFPYSARPGTPAARMPPVAAPVVADRAAQLRTEGQRRLAVHLDRQIGRPLDVLVERGNTARARDFTAVGVSPTLPPGQFATVRIASHDGSRLVADVA